jgi:hypothetical protein
MRLLDLTIPLGIGTPPWPTYEPLQVKYFKRLAPNGANGLIVTTRDGGARVEPKCLVSDALVGIVAATIYQGLD